MKLADALFSIRDTGYCVTFERKVAGLLHSDHFPDRDEQGLSLNEAWRMAYEFAAHNNDVVNVHVVSKSTFVPVEGYEHRILNKYP